MRAVVRILMLSGLLAGVASASLISYVDVQLGTWNGSSFTADGLSEWSTNNPGTPGLGVSDPPNLSEPISLLYNAVSSDLALADGEYYFWMAELQFLNPDTASAVQITIGREDTSTATEVYTTSDPNGVQFGGTPLTLVQGGGFSAGQLLASQGSTTPMLFLNQSYTDSDYNNWALDVTTASTPEPASWLLLACGFAGLIYARRRRLVRPL